MNETETRELVPQEPGAMMIPAELSVADVVAQVQKIQTLMSSVMSEGEHFGVIPGTDKPSLLQPGAQKINFVFRLGDRTTQVKQIDLPNGHREYQVTLDIVHIPTGLMLAQGLGLCSTMESKYRWRKQYTETEVGVVPKEYWSIDRDDWKGRQAALVSAFGPGKYKPKKAGGQWVVMRIEGDGERVENPDIADTYNTVLKMADKRAYIHGTIKATAASDLFTQDLEDFAGAAEAHQAPGDKIPEEQKAPPPRNATPHPDPDRQLVIDQIGEVVKDRYFTPEDRSRYRNRVKAAGNVTELRRVLEQAIAERATLQSEVPQGPADPVAEEAWEQTEMKP